MRGIVTANSGRGFCPIAGHFIPDSTVASTEGKKEKAASPQFKKEKAASTSGEQNAMATQNRPRPYTTTSAWKVRFGINDLVVIGITNNSYDVARVDSVTDNKVDITYMKCRPGKQLAVWIVDGNNCTDRIHINTVCCT